MTHPASASLKPLLIGAGLLALLCILCCGDSGPQRSGSGGSSRGGSSSKKRLSSEEIEKRAKNTYETVCLTCHGRTGGGDGPGSAALDPKPRTFTDTEWQKSVTDDHIKKVIVYGGAAAGKNVNMPAHPLLKGQDEVLGGLVAIIRGFGKSQ